MSHQTLSRWVKDDSEDGGAYTPFPAETFPVLRSWEIGHYGGSQSADTWRQIGDITIRELEFEGYYLESRVSDKPFFSVLAILDQWGTWYTIKLDHGDILRHDAESGEVTYAQEWGEASFVRTLGVALTALADLAEPKPGEYDGTLVKETTPERTP